MVIGNERFIINFRKDHLPYIPLTRKQYLTALREKLQKEENSIIYLSLQSLKKQAQKPKTEQYWEARYDLKIKRIDDYLAVAKEEELSKNATAKDIKDFKKFSPEQEGEECL
jgi:hypothetical protein